ncbi:hypothetical protein SPILM97S_01701 [Streptomyces pilosus]
MPLSTLSTSFRKLHPHPGSCQYAPLPCSDHLSRQPVRGAERVEKGRQRKHGHATRIFRTLTRVTTAVLTGSRTRGGTLGVCSAAWTLLRPHTGWCGRPAVLVPPARPRPDAERSYGRCPDSGDIGLGCETGGNAPSVSWLCRPWCPGRAGHGRRGRTGRHLRLWSVADRSGEQRPPAPDRGAHRGPGAAQDPLAAGSRIATHSTWCVIGKMLAWAQAGKQQVRSVLMPRMEAAGHPERQMSVTALHRFGAGNLARHAYLRSVSPGTEPHVSSVTSVRPVRMRGSPSKGQCDRNSLTRPLRAWEACPACCTPPGDGATYFDHPGHEHAVGCLP